MVYEIRGVVMVETSFYKRWEVPPGFKSDGCTLPWLLFFLVPLFEPYKAACRWHDWARRHLVHHRVLTVQQADNEFRKHMIDLGAWRWFARFVWLFVKLTRSRYSRTLPVPREWERYLKQTM